MGGGNEGRWWRGVCSPFACICCGSDGLEWLHRNILKLRKELEQPSASKSDTIPKTTKKPVSKRPIKNILTVEKRTADVEGSTAQKTTSITAESLRKAYNKMWQVRSFFAFRHGRCLIGAKPIRLKGQAFVKDKEKNEPLPPIQGRHCTRVYNASVC